MLRNLAKYEVSELLRLVAEVQNASVLANDKELLFSDVNNKLRP